MRTLAVPFVVLLVGCEPSQEDRLLECMKNARDKWVAQMCRYTFEEQYVQAAKLEALRKEVAAHEAMFEDLEKRLPEECPDLDDLSCFGDLLRRLTIEHGLVEFSPAKN